MTIQQVRDSRNIRLILAVAVLVFLGSIFAWWKLVYSTPSRTFDRMLGNMLSTTTVTKQTAQDSSSDGLHQTIVISGSPVHAVTAHNVLKQGAATTVTTNSIGTPSADYVQYESITTDQKSKEGKDLDFSGIVNVWGKSATDPATGSQAQLYGQTVYSVVPVGNLSPAMRRELLGQMHRDQVYHVDYGGLEYGLVNGRPVYIYPVTIPPLAYVTMLKTFDQLIGANQLKQVDPNQYANAAPLQFKFVVDKWSAELVSVGYTNSPRQESYSAYGVRNSFNMPETTIPLDELQQRLQQVQ